MHALRNPSFLRPSSRPSSPAPVSPMTRTSSEPGSERTLWPHHKISLSSLSNFRKPAVCPPSPNSPPALLIQDGSYLEALGLKLSEAVSKALSQPATATGGADVLNGKRPIPEGRGRALGALIAAELKATHGNVHLQRAILRLLQRPLSVVLTNLSSNLLPLLSSPAFLTPPAPSVQNPNPNPTQNHALALAHFAGELLDSISGLDLDASHDLRGDGLKAVKEGLASLVGRVVNPLVAGVKNELIPIIQGLEQPNPAWSMNGKTPNGTKALHSHQHHSIAALHSIIPVYAKALARYTSPPCCQTNLAALLICLVWRGLVALAHRPSAPRQRSSSFSAPVITASSTLRKRLGGSRTPPTTPPDTPPASKFTIKLPPTRPPSPPTASIPTTAADTRSLYDLLGTLPKPAATNQVAHEAVDEAFEALAALTALLSAVNSGSVVREDLDLELLTTGLPVLIAIPVLIRWAGRDETNSISTMLVITETEYRDGCLAGFGRADECTGVVGQRVLEILRIDNTCDTKTQMIIKWLELKIAEMD
ncbi:hypothetical protein BD410DRAFT_571484 [Rickenella mellea]|uniref:Uncharacterized protein n=1 Tax=Rickenella mellea TaxID=50990 RepID=A0A4Y7QH61_9AGAM|nr:hypothetical protein BD410DRAFT_571484 [Rickenella mellea]